MLQNASYVFFQKKKNNKISRLRKKRKKYHPAGVEPETFEVYPLRHATIAETQSICEINCI